MGLGLVSLTLQVLGLNGLDLNGLSLNPEDSLWKAPVAAGLLLAAMIYRTYPWLDNRGLYGLTWAVELVVLQVATYGQWWAVTLTLVHLGLAFGSQILGEWWRHRHPHISLNSVDGIPLVYGGLAALSRLRSFAVWTGLSSLALAFLCCNLGRRSSQWRWLTYFGLGLFTVSTYELVGYGLHAQTPAQTPEVQGMAFAIVTTIIAYGYQGLKPYLAQYLRVQRSSLSQIAHFHWLWATALLWWLILIRTPFVAPDAPSPDLLALGSQVKLGIGLLLAVYALILGRSSRQNPAPYPAPYPASWVYLSFLHLGVIFLYGWFLLPGPVQTFLWAWGVAIVAPLCALVFWLPWQRWGWPLQPWRQLGLSLPFLLTLVTWQFVTSPSLLVAACSYGILAQPTRQIRLTYLSALFIDIALWRWFEQANLNDPLWYSLPLGLAVLWIAQVDPYFTQTTPQTTPQPIPKSSQREQRHRWRLVGIGLICGVALWPSQMPGLAVGALTLATVGLGLGLKVRAFLFGGTIVFVANGFYQAIVLAQDQAFLKWALFLLGGISLLWIGATFETRRDQVRVLLQGWATELDRWQ
jgi:hypothetical protein